MANIVLIRPKILIEYAMPNPPLGLGYLEGILRAHGHQVDILDCAIMKESYPKYDLRGCWSHQRSRFPRNSIKIYKKIVHKINNLGNNSLIIIKREYPQGKKAGN